MKQKEQRYWVYAIKSESTERIYIGQTSDLDERVRKHNSGEVYSTKCDRPWRLFACQEFESRSQAMWKENEIKQSKGKRLRWIEEKRLNEPTPRREGRYLNSGVLPEIE